MEIDNYSQLLVGGGLAHFFGVQAITGEIMKFDDCAYVSSGLVQPPTEKVRSSISCRGGGAVVSLGGWAPLDSNDIQLIDVTERLSTLV